MPSPNDSGVEVKKTKAQKLSGLVFEIDHQLLQDNFETAH
jgi:hypothetical protein